MVIRLRLFVFPLLLLGSLPENSRADCADFIGELAGDYPSVKTLKRRVEQAQELAMLEYRVLIRGINLSHNLSLNPSAEELAIQAAYGRMAEAIEIADEILAKRDSGIPPPQEIMEALEGFLLDGKVTFLFQHKLHEFTGPLSTSQTGTNIYSGRILKSDSGPWAPRWNFVRVSGPTGGSVLIARNDADHSESKLPQQYLEVLNLIRAAPPPVRTAVPPSGPLAPTSDHGRVHFTGRR